ncbi:hypothetical protein Avbf_12516 [Armadillidium vulgare]|nr:hypothetical protein Avbf_12516 [Armadillidium vulgare]
MKCKKTWNIEILIPRKYFPEFMRICLLDFKDVLKMELKIFLVSDILRGNGMEFLNHLMINPDINLMLIVIPRF